MSDAIENEGIAMNQPTKRYRWDQGVACQSLSGTAFVYRDRRLISLNEVGSYLWQFCEEARTMEDLVERVLQEFEVDEPTARQDVVEFLNDLVGRKLLIELELEEKAA